MGGPLIGSLLVDTSAGVSALLIWVTLAGTSFGWVSAESALFVGGGGLAVVAFVVTELRVREPIVPLRLFRDRTTTLSIIASVAIGVAMFGSTVFLGQDLQISRGYSPTAAGLLTLPMVGGLLVSSTVSGILISRHGRWKAYLVAGSVLVVAGFGLLATVDHATDMVLLGCFLAVLGVGIGMTMQNLVLAVQNTVAPTDLGAASSAVAFFRSLGGTIGVSVLGAVLSSRVGGLISAGLADVPGAPAAGSGEVGLADLADASPVLRELIAVSYGDATGRVFLVSALLSLVTIVAVLLIREVALRTESGEQQLQSARRATADGPLLDAPQRASTPSSGAAPGTLPSDAEIDEGPPPIARRRAFVVFGPPAGSAPSVRGVGAGGSLIRPVRRPG